MISHLYCQRREVPNVQLRQLQTQELGKNIFTYTYINWTIGLDPFPITTNLHKKHIS